MPIVPLYGHEHVRRRLLRLADAGSLPASLLFTGERGVGKQRLALWLANVLQCEQHGHPCDGCMACRLVAELRHPDVYWVFPRTRSKESDTTPAEAIDDMRDACEERAKQHGLYARPPRSDGIFISTILGLVHRAALAPAMGRRKVFIVGDAERMVAQEGSDQAANAFLKLLEEPPADTTIILTSSEPAALLPTIHSRTVAFRIPLVDDPSALDFVRNPEVKSKLDELGLPRGEADRVRQSAGAPGALLSVEALNAARQSARRLMQAASSRGAERYATALAQGAAGARGPFSDTLIELAALLRERASSAVAAGDTTSAYRASRAVAAVAEAQARADGNVNPQLITAELLRALDGVGG